MPMPTLLEGAYLIKHISAFANHLDLIKNASSWICLQIVCFIPKGNAPCWCFSAIFDDTLCSVVDDNGTDLIS